MPRGNMPTGLDHKYVDKEEHVIEIRYGIGDIVERGNGRENYGPVLMHNERAVITRIYDTITEAADGSGEGIDTTVVLKIVESCIDHAIGRELEDYIENVQLPEVT